MNLSQVSKYFLTEHADIIHPFLERIADASDGEFSAEGLGQALMAGYHKGFIYKDTNRDEVKGFLIVVKVQYADGGNTLVIMGAAGVLDTTWEDAARLLDELAEVMGCGAVEVRGRKGFARALKTHGWNEKYRVLHKSYGSK
jgi:hypothetical protein